MGQGINKVHILGRMTRDPDVKKEGDNPVVSIGIATNRTWKDKNNEKVEKADFHDVTLFGHHARFCINYTKKGDQVYVEGRNESSQWEDEKGNKRYSYKVVGERFESYEPRPNPKAELDDDMPFK